MHEWEVPFDWPETWPESALPAFDDFHKQRIRMQQQMDQSIAAHADQEVLYDQPSIAKNRLRITGPFTVEAVPFPSVKALDEASGPDEADTSIARTGESGRQHQWRDELLKAGIRGKGGQLLKFADLEALPSDNDIRNLHAVGHLDSGERVVVSFGPEHAALEQRQVANALNEAGSLFPLPKMIVFCAFTFDPEAAKDTGKTHLATALGVAGITRHNKRVRFYSTVDLVNLLEQEKAASRAGRLAFSLLRMDLVILDELGYLPFSPSGGALLFHLLSKLYEHTSVMITTNLTRYAFLADQQLIDASRRLENVLATARAPVNAVAEV